MPVYGYAQTPLDAGALQQQIEKQRPKIFPPGTALSPLEDTPVLKEKNEADKVTITIKRFRFDGNVLLSEKELTQVVESYLNRPLSFQELQDAAAAVGAAYREKGWVVRSFLPKQDIVDGIVTIKIIEAKFGKTKTEGKATIRLPPGWIDSMITIQQQPGKPLNTQKLDRALLLIDDLPGVNVSGRLYKGEKNGETNLILKHSAGKIVSGGAIADNEGSRSTGEKRLHSFAQLNNPLGVGDQSSLYFVGSEGLRFLQLEQTFPVGYRGLRVGGNARFMRYEVIPDEFKALDSKGNSASLGLQASYPLIRARQKNLYLKGSYDHKYFNNESQGAKASNYQIDDYTLILKGNMLDKLGGGGSTDFSVGVTAGRQNMHAINNGEDPDLNGDFYKMSYNISRQQSITPTLSFYGAFSGQASSHDKLDSSEMFYLGGANGVRAYPVSEGAGVEGYLLNTELQWQFHPSVRLTGFYDHGYVHNTGNIKSYSLDGAGVAVDWQADNGFDIRASWARRIGDNPNPTSTNRDQDGSLIDNRLWLKLSKRF